MPRPVPAGLEPDATAEAPPTSTPLVLLVVGGLLATLIVVFLVSRLEERSARADFLALAQQRFTLLDASIDRALDGLMAAGAYFDASSDVSSRQFGLLVQPILARQPALKALEWVPYTPAAQLDSIRRARRQQGLPGFEIRELGADGKLGPVSPRAEYFPVCYVEPMRGNERAFGFDLGSNPARFQALDMARREGRMVATARITLVQEQEKEFGFLLFRPIYSGVAPASAGATLVPDPSALRGYVLGVFRLGQLIGMNDSQWRGPPLAIYVFDQQGKPGETLLYPSDAKAQSVDRLPHGVSITHELHVGGRAWTVVAQPPGGVLHVDRTSTRILLVAGILLTVLLALLQEQNRNRTRAIERTVAIRTADLLESESRLIQANHEAVQANRLKTMFLASMSHEFRTPMNAILGLLHVLGRTPLEAGQRDYVDKISSAARRLLRLIDDILDVSRIEAGKLSVEREPFMLEAVLRDVLVAVAPKLRDKPIELVFDIDPSIPAHLVGDGMRLTQILVNLADNAAKFTQQGEVVLSLGWTAQSEQRLTLHASVLDTGPGLSDSDVRTVFKPFVQAESSRQRQHGGTGLGLAICRQLVNLMGGDIAVESQLGVGSNFRFDVPLGISSPAPLVGPRAGQTAPTVLILDGHVRAAAALSRMVAAFGAPVDQATDLPDARQLLTGRQYDLILVANGFALDDAAIGALAGDHRSRILRLANTGTSLHGGGTTVAFEKPLLPGLLAAALFLVARAQPVMPRPIAPTVPGTAVPGASGAPPAAGATPAEVAASSVTRDSPETLRALVEPLRVLLLRGDPDAEGAARSLARWADRTPYAHGAADVLRHTSNFDFRDALAELDGLCPPERSQEA